MQKIVPQNLPPKAESEGTRKISDSAAQPASAAMQLARRIRREQGVDQVRRFLIAMEPFLAPYERMAIAEHMGIRLPPSQPSGGQAGGQTRPMNQPGSPGVPQNPPQQGRACGAPAGGSAMGNGQANCNPAAENTINAPTMNCGSPNGSMNEPMNPQMQMLNMLSQMSNSAQAGFNPMMLAQMMGNLGMGNFRR